MDERILTVLMVLQPLDLSDIIPNHLKIEDPDPDPMTWMQMRKEMMEFPLTLRRQSLAEMNLSMSQLRKWRVETGQHHTHSLQLGELTIHLSIPERHQKNACSDCGRPLGLFLVTYEWAATWKGRYLQGGSQGTWCPMCQMRAKELPDKARHSIGHELMRVNKSRKGWGTKQDKMISKEASRLELEYVKNWRDNDRLWWETQRTENTDLYQEYTRQLEEVFSEMMPSPPSSFGSESPALES